ncbi:MAG: hypothetical protein L6Q40_07530 [Azonexus sp.]|nr:hypothetical protein [Azonexus sp.]
MAADKSFRLQCRINRTEYEDVVSDLERFTGDDRNARAKMLLRAGLISITGRTASGVSVMPAPPTSPPVTNGPLAPDLQSVGTPASRNGADIFDALGFDPAEFKFGTA